jgi:uncharacterized protein
LIPEAAAYWDGLETGELRIQRCQRCSCTFFYARRACPVCWSEDVRWLAASGKAALYSYIINHQPAPDWDGEVPYIVAIVELAEGPRLMTNIVGVPPDPAYLDLDMPLTVQFASRDGQTLPMFAPDRGHGPE